MSGIDIAIIVVVVALFLSAIGYIVYRKVRGKGGCDCGANRCAACGLCNRDKSEKPNEGEGCPFCCSADGKKSE